MPTRTKLSKLLSHPRLPWWLGLLALLLVSPTLLTGLAVDDHVQRHMLIDQAPNLMARSASELYCFMPHDAAWNAQARETGVLPWFASPGLFACFWRPLTSWSIYLDSLWGAHSVVLAHLQSALWYAALVVVVSALLRRLLQPSWLAGLAGLLFAIDEGHGFVTGWLANRNALTGMFFAALALLLHLKWRQDGHRLSAWLAPLALLAGLLSGEIALSITAYLFAYALFREPGSLRARAMTLWPYVLVTVFWRIAYTVQGYGAGGSSMYIDPGRSPLRFVEAMLERLPLLVEGQLAVVPPELLMMFFPDDLTVVSLIAAAACALMLRASVAANRATSAFWITALLLAAVPICATLPHERLLLPLGIAGSALVAQLLVTASRWVGGAAKPTLGLRVLGGFWALFHLVLAPLLLPLKAYSLDSFGALFEAPAISIDGAGRVEGRDLIFVNGPNFFFTSWTPVIRRARRLPLARRNRVLGTTMASVTITRVAPRTLRLRPENGYLSSPMDRLLRDTSREPFVVGQEIVSSEVTIEITEVTPDGRPAELLCRFSKALDDDSLLLVVWTNKGYQRFEPPALGQSVLTQSSTFLQLLAFSQNMAPHMNAP